MFRKNALRAATALALIATAAQADTITIATVNNADMIRMQGLTEDFTKQNPDIQLEWVTLEETILRQRVTTDIATKGGQYDVVTIGGLEAPIWAQQGWLMPLDDLGADWDIDDILPPIRNALSVDGKLYAAPFYGESAMVHYRKDLVELPQNPTWDDIRAQAEKATDKSKEQYGICLRGKPSWGENMAFITAMANSYGARWFDGDWKPQFDSPEWKAVMADYLDMMEKYGPPGASSNGYNETMALFTQGKCAMWIDASVAASTLADPAESKVADQMAWATFPTKGDMQNHGNWLWAWSLAVPASTDAPESAKKFVAWATSKGYTNLVAEKQGWVKAPPGTRTSLYKNAEYLAAAPFAEPTMRAIDTADTQHPSVQDVPYVGGQFVSIPEFQGIGTAVGQQFSAALAGQSTGEQALQSAQQLTERDMKRAGYIK